ncbi:hypothetical protein ZIOFF_021735 [Zingiber officinale]|uniref:Uncharacterized protein n=1 Tax=Zingiber officinale TaxID=94328 RepID=A0A8J5HKH2_ZINOF|nr:hypothetical protein ZIOFF_021735 [Zingiber officinale]
MGNRGHKVGKPYHDDFSKADSNLPLLTQFPLGSCILDLLADHSFSLYLSEEEVALSSLAIDEATRALFPRLSFLFKILGHAVLALILWSCASSLDLTSKATITSFYMFIWKLFYAEYLLIPLVLYGADFDTGVFSSGFPKELSSEKVLALGDQYMSSGWNLNNFPWLPDSVLRLKVETFLVF